MKIWLGANACLILLLSIIIVIVTVTLFSTSNGDSTQEAGKFASAQAQTNNSTTINLTGILGPPLYHSNSGKITAQRIINVGEIPETEESILERGTMIGVGNVTNAGTFVETYKTNKIIYGEGKGIITAENSGDIVSWTSHDIGKINPDKSAYYRGIMFFSLGSSNKSSNGKLGFLDNTPALYTTSVGTNGSTLRQIWQLK